MANEIMNASAVSNVMAKIYKLRPDKAQFARLGKTTKHFKPRGMKMKGEEFHFKVFTQPLTAVRRTSVDSSGSEAEFPKARQIDHVDITIDWDDLIEFQSTITYTGLAKKKTESMETAVYNVAQKLIGQVDQDFANQLNVSIHQNSDCVMALVAAAYDADGTTLNSETDAYLQIDTGSISQFVKGQVIDIRQGSTNGSLRCTCEVKDVYHTAESPGSTSGPGITVSIVAENSDDANFDSVVDGDEIVLSGETDDNIQGFPTWFSTASVFSLTRTTLGYHWAVPYTWPKAVGGLAVTLDIDEHMGQISEEMSMAIEFGRQTRKTEGISVDGAMLAIASTKLVAEATRQIGDSVRFTSDMDGAERKRLYGRSGFEGAYFHSPFLGPVTLQGDPVATPHTIRFLEIDSWFWVTGHDGNQDTVEWLDKDGSRWHYILGGNGRLKNQLQAGCLTRVCLGCDQPQANVSLTGVKSSLE